jgi:hypothetical protein
MYDDIKFIINRRFQIIMPTGEYVFWYFEQAESDQDLVKWHLEFNIGKSEETITIAKSRILKVMKSTKDIYNYEIKWIK